MSEYLKSIVSFNLRNIWIQYVKDRSDQKRISKSAFVEGLIRKEYHLLDSEPKVIYGSRFYPVHIDNEELEDILDLFFGYVSKHNVMKAYAKKMYRSLGVAFEFELGDVDLETKRFMVTKSYSVSIDPEWKILDFLEYTYEGEEITEILRKEIDYSILRSVIEKRKSKGNYPMTINSNLKDDSWLLVRDYSTISYLRE